MLQNRSNLKAKLTSITILGMLLLLPSGTIFAHGNVDQGNPVSGGGSQILAHMPIGQEFIPSQPILVAVDIFFRGGTEEGSDTITINIRKGTITSHVLATTSQLVAACPFTPPFTCIVHFDFLTPLSVNTGDKYVLELQGTNPTHAWQSDFGAGDYPGGAAIIQGVVFPEQDFGFQTYFQVPSNICDIQLNKTSFVNGDQVIAQVARLANTGSNSVPVEVKLWFELPGSPPPVPFLTVGADGSFVLPPGFNHDFGPLPLATVQASYPRGGYSFNCRLLHAVTGAPLAEAFNPFQLQ